MLNGHNGKDNKKKTVFFNLLLEIFTTKIDSLVKNKKSLFFSIFINTLSDKITEEYELAILIQKFELETKTLEKKINKINKKLQQRFFYKIKSFLLKKKLPDNKTKKVTDELERKLIFESERVINNKNMRQIELKLNRSERLISKKIPLNAAKKNINFDELDRFLRKKKYMKYGGRLVFLKQKSKINRKKLKNHVDKFENYLNVNY